MEKTISGKKATYTALCIIPPSDIWPDIQSIRSLCDPAYKRWMPHINLAFPFVPPEDFDKAKALLEAELADFKAFRVTFKELGYFAGGKKGVLWARPDVSEDQLSELENRIVKVFPFCNDQLKKSTNGFHPHLTLGNFNTKEIADKKAEYQKDWSTKEFMVDKVNMIKRDGQDSPFYVVHTIPLKLS
eukprot:TRINITY_DN10999_c0_g1_i1.p1 TRINITY_DN10999_c0_g1~~TRINITY_DN10999_c0_g1_i1.p1  ORF type:complete len:187 (-),score=43.67 TRINITY_DN10999_c0_g1_i1:112-672(-)